MPPALLASDFCATRSELERSAGGTLRSVRSERGLLVLGQRLRDLVQNVYHTMNVTDEIAAYSSSASASAISSVTFMVW